jgi:lipoprotein-anchoring transpeptidase ErfK/SrfK
MRRQPSRNPLRRTLIAIAILSLSIWLLKPSGPVSTSHAVIELPEAPMPPLAPTGSRWVTEQASAVRTAPSFRSEAKAWIGANEPFEAFDFVEGTQCGGAGWAETAGKGFVCLEGAKLTEEAPVRLPRLIRFVHPDPKDWNEYMETMSYDTNPSDKIDALVPFIYAKRWGKWRGHNFETVAAYVAGDPPTRRLSNNRKYHFVDAENTERGTVLVRENGQAIPADQVHIYPLTKFHGWNMLEEPVPAGFLPAWAINYDGTPIHVAPDPQSEVAERLPYHTALVVEDEPVDRAGNWWMMPNGLGPGVPGFVQTDTGIRRWNPAPAEDDVTPGEVWLDVDLEQQILAVRRGQDVEFVTLVSTGSLGTLTPRGLFEIQSKTAWGDMASRPDSDDPYYVEKVPWVMSFKARYALHGAFWHWGFGHPASHGCINLSVRDARWIYDRVSPIAYGGWQTAMATGQERGTTLRVRRGISPVTDRRKPARSSRQVSK